MVLLSIAFVAMVLELIRRRRLKEEYSLLWLAAGGGLLVLSVGRPLLDEIAALLGIYYAPSAMFLLGGLGAMAIGLHLTMVISRLTDQNRALAQRLALLEERVRSGEDPPVAPPGQSDPPPDPASLPEAAGEADEGSMP
jgi:hypothetical protein